MKRVVEGESIKFTHEFVDEMGDPYIPAEGQSGPTVELVDTTDGYELVSRQTATPDIDISGQWEVDLGVPLLHLEDTKVFTVNWSMYDDEGSHHTVKDYLTVEPIDQNRVTDLVVLVKNLTRISFHLPFPYDADKHDIKINLYRGNDAYIDAMSIEDSSVDVHVSNEMTTVRCPAVFKELNLMPHTLAVEVEYKGTLKEDLLSYNVWFVTPQVLTAAGMVESFINRAKLDNVIPELEYTQQDLVSYLHRGLNLLNQMAPRITAWTGMDMRGVLLNMWVTCATYYALAAQLQAEGALAFDFGGQTTNFNVDRSPSIEAALGRVEQELDRVKESKALLARAGYVSGDGSRADTYMSGAQNFGVLGITQSPTTRRNLTRVRSRIHRS